MLRWLKSLRRSGDPLRLSNDERELVRAHLPAYDRFDDARRTVFDHAVCRMVRERNWEGCEGLAVTDEMRVVISSNASLLLLGTPHYFFDSVGVILIYPELIRRLNGLHQDNLGEAWSNGAIVLSWPEVMTPRPYRQSPNVVIHEFAHHLDGLDGEMGGSIPFSDRRDQDRWEELSARELANLISDIRSRKPTIIDPYAATNSAEFFAVVSEHFFETPRRLKSHHGELHQMLVKFYGVDPIEWQSE